MYSQKSKEQQNMVGDVTSDIDISGHIYCHIDLSYLVVDNVDPISTSLQLLYLGKRSIIG